MDAPRVRVLVVGDSGVGKTAVVRRITEGPGDWAAAGGATDSQTTGCGLSVMLHDYPCPSGDRQHFVEFFDVGGHQRYAPSRPVFYSGVHGVILVYDVTNRRSYVNLRRWMTELAVCERERGGVFDHGHHHAADRVRAGGASGASLRPRGRSFDGDRERERDGEQQQQQQQQLLQRKRSALGTVPVLVLGNKTDLRRAGQRPENPLEDFRVEGTEMSAVSGAVEWDRVSRFLNKVVRSRFYMHGEDKTPMPSSRRTANDGWSPARSPLLRPAASPAPPPLPDFTLDDSARI